MICDTIISHTTPIKPAELLTDVIRLQVSVNDQDDVPESPRGYSNAEQTPSSPPPSFRSRTSSPSSRHFLSSEDPIASEAERTLADTFDDGSDSDDDDDNTGDDRQRLMRTSTAQQVTDHRVVHDGDRPNLPRSITRFPGSEVPPVAFNVPTRPNTRTAPISSLSQSNDGVFANLSAKPERGEKLEEQPPVSLASISVDHDYVLTGGSPMKRLPQTLHPLTGRLPFSHLAT